MPGFDPSEVLPRPLSILPNCPDSDTAERRLHSRRLPSVADSTRAQETRRARPAAIRDLRAQALFAVAATRAQCVRARHRYAGDYGVRARTQRWWRSAVR